MNPEESFREGQLYVQITLNLHLYLECFMNEAQYFVYLFHEWKYSGDTFWFPADFVRLHSDKKWSVYNFYWKVYLNSERQIYQNKIQKNAFQKNYVMSEISIWSPVNQKDFWLPGVFYTCKELRLGALL